MSKTILLVEDNPQNQYLVTFLLEQSGYVVRSVRNGSEALRSAQNEPPDLILMDIQLPEIDGYGVTVQLKRLPETCHIPVIAVTSYAMAGDRERALAVGCVGYIEKPFDPQTFVAEIARFLPA
jgi:two-component system cell cycle response regulator DivK